MNTWDRDGEIATDEAAEEVLAALYEWCDTHWVDPSVVYGRVGKKLRVDIQLRERDKEIANGNV